MTFAFDPAAWEARARSVDALADGLPVPRDLPLPTDRYALALGDAPAESDAATRALHAAAVAELRDLAARIRAQARAVRGADDAAARVIEAVR